MPVTIRVQNFQSIADATVVVDGFTVVTGKNNSGKSAFQRAVRGAFQNARGSSFVRRGTAKAIVDIDLSNGHTVHWEKSSGKDTKPTYIIDNGPVIHPGQGVPEELPVLGVRPVLAGGKTLWPQFAPQFTGQVFLLDESGSVLAEAIADVDRVSQLNQALKLAESDRRAAVSELKFRRVDLDKLERELTRYAGVDDLDALFGGIEKDQKQLARIEAVVSGLKILEGDYVKAAATVAAFVGIESVDVPGTQDIEQVRAVSNELEILGVLHSRFKNAAAQVNRLVGLEKVDVGIDVAPLGRIVAALSILDGLESRWGLTNETVDSAKEDVANAVREAEIAENQVAEFLKEIGTCPYCGALTAGPAHKGPCHEESS